MLRISISTQLRALKILIFWVLALIAGYGILFKFNQYVMLPLIIFILLFLIPTLILHIQYWLQNRGMVINISSTEIVVETDKSRKEYKFDEVKEIIFCKQGNLDPPVMYFTPMDLYYYAKFIFKNGESLIISSLIAPNIENELKKITNVRISREKRLCFLD
jgi:hypothetical protein